jgi:hypothetical protein
LTTQQVNSSGAGVREQAAPDQQSQGDAADDRANTVSATRMKLHVCSEGGTSVAAKCEKSKRRIVMVTLKKCLPALALSLAVTVLASPSHARVPEISAARARAIHECSVAADRYPQYLRLAWPNMANKNELERVGARHSSKTCC